MKDNMNIKSVLLGIQPISTQKISSNLELYEELKILTGVTNSRRHLLLHAYKIIDGVESNQFNNCVICGKLFSFSLRSDLSGIKHVCSRSCEQKRRHMDPNYTQNIKEKSNITKNTTIIDGLNMHQIGANRAAETIKQRYSAEERVEQLKKGKLIVKERKFEEIQKRITNLINYFGIHRFLTLTFRFKYQTRSYLYFAKFVENIVNYTNRSNIDDEEIRKLYFSSIHKTELISYCSHCSKQYSKIEFSSKFVYKIHNTTCCSKSCSQLYYMTTEKRISKSIEMRNYYAKPGSREKTSDTSKKSWENRDKEEWVQKYLKTMGSIGVIERTRKASQTKFDRGLVSVIHGRDNSPYANYKRKVKSVTNNQDISTLQYIENRSKREYHLDHIFPISRGYVFKIPAELIGDKENLQMLWGADNQKKTNNIIEIPEHILKYLQNYDTATLEEILNEISQYKKTKI